MSWSDENAYDPTDEGYDTFNTSKMKNEMTIKEIYKALREPLPKEALKPIPGGAKLTAINPMYVVDRLNKVFGLGKWYSTYELISEGTNPVMKCTLTVPEYDIVVEQYGGNKNPDLGDAYKGAATDSLTKCASYLGVGIAIYMGLKDDTKVLPKSQQSDNKPKPILTTEILDMAIKSIKAGETGIIKRVESKYQLTEDQLELMIDVENSKP